MRRWMLSVLPFLWCLFVVWLFGRRQCRLGVEVDGSFVGSGEVLLY
jgi:hypothetical protein